MVTKILCVDDDPITLMLYKMVIRKAEFAQEIATARNGEEALAFFDINMPTHTKEYPKLIFLDLNMPVMGGWEFLDHFNEKYQSFTDTKVIVLSSTIDPRDIDKAKTYPMVIDFQSKPISKEMLANLKTTL